MLVNPGSIQEMPEPQGDSSIEVFISNPNPSLVIDSPVQERSQGEIDTEANPNPNPHPDLAIWSPLRAQGRGGNSTNPDPDPNTSQAVTVRAEYKREPLMPLKANAMSMGAAVAATLPPTPPRGGGPGRTRTAMEANIVVQHKGKRVTALHTPPYLQDALQRHCWCGATSTYRPREEGAGPQTLGD